MKKCILLLLMVMPSLLLSQQITDTTYNPIIQNPVYEPGKGSVIFIDEGHHNFHTKNGRYKAFSNLLERDGYKVIEYKGPFDEFELTKGKILVISNALNEINVDDWFLPNPSAFTKSEIETLKKWVFEGGSLFLIADHMPMAGAATELAAVFEFEFTNGFVFGTVSKGAAIFNLKEKMLHEFNHDYIGAKLSITKGNITQAAKKCHMDRQALQQLMKRFEIDPNLFR